jgi:hypothetical protein
MGDSTSSHQPLDAHNTAEEAEEGASPELAPEPQTDPVPSPADDLAEKTGPQSKFHG